MQTAYVSPKNIYIYAFRTYAPCTSESSLDLHAKSLSENGSTIRLVTNLFPTFLLSAVLSLLCTNDSWTINYSLFPEVEYFESCKGPQRLSQECHFLQMSDGVRAQILSLQLVFALRVLLSMPFSCREKIHLGKQEESNKLPYVSKRGKRAVGPTVIDHLLCVGMGLLHILTWMNPCDDPVRRCCIFAYIAYSEWLLRGRIRT